MKTEEQTQQTLFLLKKHLMVQEGEPLAAENLRKAQMDELHQQLTRQIAWLLDHQFERLLQAMYRIDVSEEDFRAILTGKEPVAPALATLVLEREAQKVLIRAKYSSGKALV